MKEKKIITALVSFYRPTIRILNVYIFNSPRAFLKTTLAPAEPDVKPVTRHQTSCPDLPTTHHMTVTLPPHRVSVTVNPVSTVEHLVNDDFNIGPRGPQKKPIVSTPSRE
jgi:hypothetical protein